MNTKCNPIHKKGDRNVFCPYYGNCLDYAIEKSWEYWDCCDCGYQFNEEGSPELQLTASGTIAYYEVKLELKKS
jgi:hypothetical protein